MLSDTNAKKNEADTEEGEIAGGSGTAAVEESGENLAGVTAGHEDLLKPGTCFMGRSLMTQSELDALVSEGCFLVSDYRLHGKETTPKPQKNESVVFMIFSLWAFGFQCRKDSLKSWWLTMFKFISRRLIHPPKFPSFYGHAALLPERMTWTLSSVISRFTGLGKLLPWKMKRKKLNMVAVPFRLVE
jgi:hypothetical protein